MFYLKRNLPGLERGIRLFSGLSVAVLTFFAAPSALWMLLGMATAVTLIGTAMVGFCPACAMLGRKPLSKA